MGISIVGVFYNCQKTLISAIHSVLPYCDEFIAIDQGSTDCTSEILKQYADYYELTDNKGYCEYHREYAISKAKNDWILWLDGDEIWENPLMNYIKNTFIKQNIFNNLKVSRKTYIDDIFFQREYNISPRFWNKKGVTYTKVIHSQPEGLTNPLERNDFFIYHYHYDKKRILEKLERYDDICDNLLAENIINEEQSKGLKGLAQLNREFIERNIK
jgi:glycosyltransferase involved in cell wall biosynthesis